MLKADKKTQFRAIAHHLKPVVIVNELTENVLNALNEALDNHELIKVQINGEREERAELTKELVDRTKTDLVQSIGKMAIIYKANPKANAKLSNIQRFSHLINK